MRLSGTVLIKAPQEKVWQYLTDPEQVTKCAPGLESMEVIAPNERFRAVASVGFGAIKATFVVDVDWTELDAPNRARMKLHGKAPGGVVDGTTEMVLSDGPEGATELAWSADLTIVGTIASLAARLMGTVSKTITDTFFKCVRKQIEEA